MLNVTRCRLPGGPPLLNAHAGSVPVGACAAQPAQAPCSISAGAVFHQRAGAAVNQCSRGGGSIVAPMTGRACVVFDQGLTEYDFGPAHPMSPVRVDLTMGLARAMDVVGGAGLQVIPAPIADDDEISTVHDTAYVQAVHRIRSAHDVDFAHGLGTGDNPTFAGMHTASAHVVGASLEAARQVWSGAMRHAANIAGGLHHAMPGQASGFCVYNDVAIAIAWLLEHGAERIAYVDVDVHHGDGVQHIFYDDPRVLTISLHESPETLFPGTGYAFETGGPGAAGASANVALPAGTADAGWLRAFHAIVPALVREFEPDILVSQQGCDSHIEDPLAHLMFDRRRSARRVPQPARARPRGLRRALAGHRWRWLCDHRCRAESVDAPARHRRRHAAGSADHRGQFVRACRKAFPRTICDGVLPCRTCVDPTMDRNIGVWNPSP